MNRLKFKNLGNSVLHSLSVGIIAFNKELVIIEHNQIADELLNLSDRIDTSLTNGDIDSTIDWKRLLEETVKQEQRRVFDRFKYKKNKVTSLLHIDCLPLHETADNKLIGGLLIIKDITEPARIEAELLRSQRLATIGELASKVAHELNNPLDGIIRYLNLATRVIESGDPKNSLSYLKNSQDGLKRMTEIIKDLLDLSRNGEVEFECSSLLSLLEQSITSMQEYANSKGINIKFETGQLGLESKQNGNLYQVFCNIIKNAIDAMESGGKLEIISNINKNGKVMLSFSDNGSGISENIARDIFIPFFTTKPEGSGTGLGLAISKDIVEKNGGRISVRNNDTGGATFTVILNSKINQ